MMGDSSLEDRIKEKCLEGLLEHMQDKMGDSLADKYKAPLEVTVGAPDKEHLAEGLEHAKDLTDSMPMEGHMEPDGDETDGLMALLGDDEDDDDKMKMR